MDKLREMILYVVWRVNITSLDHLCSILYLCDFEAYSEMGEPVSQSEYIRGPQGPEPKYIRRLLIDMKSKDEIDFTENFLLD